MSSRPVETRRQAAGEIFSSESEAEDRGVRIRLMASLGGAFVVLLLLGFFVSRFVESDPAAREVRSSLSYNADGYRGLFDVLGRLGFRVERQRASYARLPPPGQSVLVIVDPLPSDLLERTSGARTNDSMARELRDWVADGGRVIAAPRGEMVASVFGVRVDLSSRRDSLERFFGDTERTILDQLRGSAYPERTWRSVAGSISGAAELSGFSDSWKEPGAEKERLAPAFLRRAGSREIAAHLEEEGSGNVEVAVFADDPPSGMDRVALLDQRLLVAAERRDSGRIWLFSSAYPFTNLGLAEGSTAPLLAALVDEASEHGKRTVLFDEYSHGLWARRGAFGWYFTTSLFYPVTAALLVVAILLWRGAVRLGPPRQERHMPRRAKEEFVVSLADILLRAERHKAAAISLLDAFRKRHAAWAHRIERLDAEVRASSAFDARALQRVDGQIQAEKSRIADETKSGASRT